MDDKIYWMFYKGVSRPFTMQFLKAFTLSTSPDMNNMLGWKGIAVKTEAMHNEIIPEKNNY